MNQSDTIQAIELAVRATIDDQRNHLARGRVERNFTVRLANKLAPHFESDRISVDAFYNKHGQITKRLNGKVIELDIAIHEAGSDDQNLVAIELEVSNTPKRDDVWKIEQLTNLGGFGYGLGLFLVIGVSARAGEIIEMRWCKNGIWI